MFHPAGGETLAHTEDRVSRVTDRSYAVGSKSGVHLDERPDSPPAGRKILDLYHKKFAQSANFL